MVGPLLQINLESVREMKDIRKHYERMVDKYDGLLNKPDKYVGKDTLRDEVYLKDTLDYLAKLRQFRISFELGLLDKIALGMGGFGEYCWTLGQLFLSLEPDLEKLREVVPKWQEDATIMLAKLKEPVNRPSAMTLLELVNQGVKSGYLFRKSPKSIKSSWKRVYAQLDGSYFVLSSLGRQRVMVSLTLSED